jgi:hypothetical protein
MAIEILEAAQKDPRDRALEGCVHVDREHFVKPRYDRNGVCSQGGLRGASAVLDGHQRTAADDAGRFLATVDGGRPLNLRGRFLS